MAKTYILTYTKAKAEEATRLYFERGNNVWWVDGEETTEERAAMVDDFRNKAEGVFVATVASMQGVYDLGPVTSTLVIEEHPNPEAVRAACGRAQHPTYEIPVYTDTEGEP